MKNSESTTSRKLIVQGKPFSLRLVLIVAFLPFVMFGLFGNTAIALITAAAASWLYFTVLIQNESKRGLSAARIYLPIFFLYNGIAVLGPSISHLSEIVYMCALSGFGFLLGWVVCFPPGRNSSGLEVLASPKVNNRIFRRPLIIMIIVITIATFAFAFLQAGTIPALSENPNAARVTFLINGYISTIVVVGLHVMIACGFIESLVLKGIHSKLFPAMVCLLGTGMALAMSNRGVAVNPLVFGFLFVVWHKNYKLRKLIPVGLVAVTALSIGGYLRNLASWGDTYNSDLQLQGFSGAGIWFAPILDYVFGTAQTFDSTIAIFPSVIPFQMGTQFFSPLLMQPSVDLFLKNVFGYDFQGFGLALGSVNAFYLDWGSVGTFVGPFVIGSGLALVYRKAMHSGAMKWDILYCYLLMQLIFSVYGHPFAYLFYILEPVVFWLLVSPSSSNRANRTAPGQAARSAPDSHRDCGVPARVPGPVI